MKLLTAVLLLLGLFLIALDILTATFFLFPIGTGFVLGSLLLLWLHSKGAFFAGFLAGLAGASAVSYALVKKVRGTAQALSEVKGAEGTVVKVIDEETYLVRFPLSAGGEEVWNAYSKEKLRYGDRVKVADVVGNKVVVEKVKEEA